jgi:6-phosphogluconate dehydrogenase (decarboxylating)
VIASKNLVTKPLSLLRTDVLQAVGNAIVGGMENCVARPIERLPPQLAACSGRVSDGGEGRGTIEAAIDQGGTTQVLGAPLFDRFSSRGAGGFADQMLSAMRHAFGGHLEKSPGAGP